MTITLDEILPLPLRDKPQMQDSQVWNRHLEIRQGDWIKVKAPSGTGKTTLVHIIWQLRNDYTGKISYDNKDAAAIPANTISEYRQHKMSIIFQDLRLFGNLTARENIELKRCMNLKPFYKPAMIDEMAEALGIQQILSQKAATCSYGEQQRIAIIRSLMQPFELLVMDEPFSHLDIMNTEKAAGLIAAECKKRGAGFLLTDLDEDAHFDYSKQVTL